MARDFEESTSDRPASSEGRVELWERIDALMVERGVSVTDLQKAAGVTWAAAKRWRQPPPLGAKPSGENLAAIARRLGVTVEELLRQWDGAEPTHASFQLFKTTDAYRRLTPRQLENVCLTRIPEDQEPTLGTWLAAAEVQFSTKPRES